MKTAAKSKEMTVVNKEQVLVLSPGVVVSLTLQGSQTSLCFHRQKKVNWPVVAAVVFVIYMLLCELRIAWAYNMFTGLSRSLVSLFGFMEQEYFFISAAHHYYPTLYIVVQD